MQQLLLPFIVFLLQACSTSNLTKLSNNYSSPKTSLLPIDLSTHEFMTTTTEKLELSVFYSTDVYPTDSCILNHPDFKALMNQYNLFNHALLHLDQNNAGIVLQANSIDTDPLMLAQYFSMLSGVNMVLTHASPLVH